MIATDSAQKACEERDQLRHRPVQSPAVQWEGRAQRVRNADTAHHSMCCLESINWRVALAGDDAWERTIRASQLYVWMDGCSLGIRETWKRALSAPFLAPAPHNYAYAYADAYAFRRGPSLRSSCKIWIAMRMRLTVKCGERAGSD